MQINFSVGGVVCMNGSSNGYDEVNALIWLTTRVGKVLDRPFWSRKRRQRACSWFTFVKDFSAFWQQESHKYDFRRLNQKNTLNLLNRKPIFIWTSKVIRDFFQFSLCLALLLIHSLRMKKLNQRRFGKWRFPALLPVWLPICSSYWLHVICAFFSYW